ncbi:MAG: DUF488 family protein [Candidatus Binatia bacterium]
MTSFGTTDEGIFPATLAPHEGNHLAGSGTKTVEDVMTLIGIARERRICQLCFERKPEECHRSLVARDMEFCGNGANLKVEHIRY